MTPEMQNRTLQGPASRDLLGGWSHSSTTSHDWRTQLIASRFALLPSMARAVSILAYGEAYND
jgi:hypothetical protein